MISLQWPDYRLIMQTSFVIHDDTQSQRPRRFARTKTNESDVRQEYMDKGQSGAASRTRFMMILIFQS